MKRVLALLILIGVAAGATFWQRSAGEKVPAATLDTLPTSEEVKGFARATEPGALVFPRDMGAHDDYQTEWWYYTGNVETEAGRPFGFQLTFFRRALTADELSAKGAGDSAWRTRQVFLAHFTVSDIDGGTFYPSERFSRAAAGLAGAQATPFRVWLDSWNVRELETGEIRLQARQEGAAIDLTLSQTLPPILHGDEGLSQKGPEPGNASYYYSLVRQQTQGTVTIGQTEHAVTGLTWHDHEFSTSALGEEAVGWDWFSLQMDDGSALMLFEIRREDGTLEPFSSGSFIQADGSVLPLTWEDWELQVLDRWRSPASGAEYPAGWRLAIPSLELELEGRPLLADQELNVSTTYWEGASAFEGTRAGNAVRAKGYVELTGYAENMRGRL